MYCRVWFGCNFFFLKNLYNSMTGCPTSHCIRTNMDCGWLRLASWNKNGVLLVNIVCEHIFNSWEHASVPRVIAGTRICKFLWECALFAAPPTDSEFSLWQIFYPTVRGLDCFLNNVSTSWRYSFDDFFFAADWLASWDFSGRWQEV